MPKYTERRQTARNEKINEQSNLSKPMRSLCHFARAAHYQIRPKKKTHNFSRPAKCKRNDCSAMQCHIMYNRRKEWNQNARTSSQNGKGMYNTPLAYAMSEISEKQQRTRAFLGIKTSKYSRRDMRSLRVIITKRRG